MTEQAPEGVEAASAPVYIPKYEFTGATITLDDGTVLRRIRCIAYMDDLATYGVTPGTLGGWIGSEANLPNTTEFAGWVGNGAWVYGDAQVLHSGRAYQNAVACGNAVIRDAASIFGGAHLDGNAVVEHSARVYDEARMTDDSRASDYSQVYGTITLTGTMHVAGSTCVYADGQVPA